MAPPLEEGSGFAGYGAFGERVVATLIDMVIVGVPVATVERLFELITGKAVSFAIQFAYFDVNAETVLYLVYATVFLGSDWDATPGKKLLQLKVVDENGRGLSLPRAAGRVLMSMISLVLLPLTWLMLAVDKRKRSLHDRLVGSFVVRVPKRRRPSSRADGGHDEPPPVPVGTTVAS